MAPANHPAAAPHTGSVAAAADPPNYQQPAPSPTVGGPQGVPAVVPMFQGQNSVMQQSFLQQQAALVHQQELLAQQMHQQQVEAQKKLFLSPQQNLSYVMPMDAQWDPYLYGPARLGKQMQPVVQDLQQQQPFVQGTDGKLAPAMPPHQQPQHPPLQQPQQQPQQQQQLQQQQQQQCIVPPNVLMQRQLEQNVKQSEVHVPSPALAQQQAQQQAMQQQQQQQQHPAQPHLAATQDPYMVASQQWQQSMTCSTVAPVQQATATQPTSFSPGGATFSMDESGLRPQDTVHCQSPTINLEADPPPQVNAAAESIALPPANNYTGEADHHARPCRRAPPLPARVEVVEVEEDFKPALGQAYPKQQRTEAQAPIMKPFGSRTRVPSAPHSAAAVESAPTAAAADLRYGESWRGSRPSVEEPVKEPEKMDEEESTTVEADLVAA